MSSAIRFIEEMGSCARVFSGPMQQARYIEAVSGGEFAGDVSRALMDRNVEALGQALCGRTVMMMQVWAPQEDDAPQEGEVPVRGPQRDDDDKKGDPDQRS